MAAKRGRGRVKGFVMPEEHRLKIANSNILNVLIEHAQGKKEISQSRVAACVALLKKVLPDLSASALSGPDGEALSIVIGKDDAGVL
jgi:hypothetical protein